MDNRHGLATRPSGYLSAARGMSVRLSRANHRIHAACLLFIGLHNREHSMSDVRPVLEDVEEQAQVSLLSKTFSASHPQGEGYDPNALASDYAQYASSTLYYGVLNGSLLDRVPHNLVRAKTFSSSSLCPTSCSETGAPEIWDGSSATCVNRYPLIADSGRHAYSRPRSSSPPRFSAHMSASVQVRIDKCHWESRAALVGDVPGRGVVVVLEGVLRGAAKGVAGEMTQSKGRPVPVISLWPSSDLAPFWQRRFAVIAASIGRRQEVVCPWTARRRPRTSAVDAVRLPGEIQKALDLDASITDEELLQYVCRLERLIPKTRSVEALATLLLHPGPTHDFHSMTVCPAASSALLNLIQSSQYWGVGRTMSLSVIIPVRALGLVAYDWGMTHRSTASVADKLPAKG